MKGVLRLYIKGHEIYNSELNIPYPGRRMDRESKMKWRIEYVESEVQKIKNMFMRQVAEYEYLIVLEIDSKANKIMKYKK